MERKHKTIRKHGGSCFNMKHYESSLLRGVLIEHIGSLQDDNIHLKPGCTLLKPVKPSKKVLLCLMEQGLVLDPGSSFSSRSCRIGLGMTVAIGDVIFFKGAARRHLLSDVVTSIICCKWAIIY